MINLKAKGQFQEIIKKYLDENASEVLTEKINSGDKTLSGCENYIKKEARKQSTGGCACIEDAVVYGWAIHYFEEDEIKEKAKAAVKAEVKTPETTQKEQPKSEIKKEQKAADEKKAAAPKDELKTEQMSIFDFLGE